LKVNDEIEGSGSGSESIGQRHGSADPDPDPPQNVMDPQHCLSAWILIFAGYLEKYLFDLVPVIFYMIRYRYMLLPNRIKIVIIYKNFFVLYIISSSL
jgi:hypothetical protein